MNTQLSPRRFRRTVLGAAAAGLAALTIAVPAQAALIAGVTNGGCTSGVQVGHITRATGEIVPICQTFG